MCGDIYFSIFAHRCKVLRSRPALSLLLASAFPGYSLPVNSTVAGEICRMLPVIRLARQNLGGSAHRVYLEDSWDFDVLHGPTHGQQWMTESREDGASTRSIEQKRVKRRALCEDCRA